ncbi:MAG: patatin-like phospholipase family protein [Proteobacteria bacterium]|nr:patatin-like phospholipase family protein [Pseudomonadota bacterium]
MPRRTQTGPASLNALVLQGGGALGAYQAGAFEALDRWSQDLDWVAGISIGAINAALIAGNPPGRRVQRLHEFWERVSLMLPVRPDAQLLSPVRSWWDDAMALWGASLGVPGFFTPRPLIAWWPQPPASWYDTAPLHQTLLELVDFGYLNSGTMRFSVGAVDVQSGNFTYFDNRRERIGPEHVMASGALPPGFGAVPIGQRWYWDGGLVSNTPLTYVMNQLEGSSERPVTVFQIDLFRARGKLPETLADTEERQKDIRFSSRTRLVSDQVRERHQLHQRLRQLAGHVPPEQRASAEVQALLAGTMDPPITLVHVIHRRKTYETQTKDYEFSRLSMVEHWQAGSADMGASLQLLAQSGPARPGEFRVFDHEPDASDARTLPPLHQEDKS